MVVCYEIIKCSISVHLSDRQNHNNAKLVLGPHILEKFDPTTSLCLVDDKIYAKLSCSLDLV